MELILLSAEKLFCRKTDGKLSLSVLLSATTFDY